MANNVIASLLLGITAKSDVSGLDKTTSSLKKMGTQASKTGGLLQKMSSKLLGGFNLNNILNWGSKYLQLEKDLGAMQSRFYAITGDQSKAREEFEYVRKLATDTSNDIKATADNYSIFYAATQKSMGTDSARQVFKDWTEVGRVLHLNTYQFERVTYALREMASKGAIYSQDLRMQIGTHVPNAMGLAEKAVNDLGITGTDWFDKFQKKAKGNQALINEFIKGFSRYANMEFASPQALKEALKQPDALANAIKNIGMNFMIEFSRKGGSEMVVKILTAIKDTLLKIDYEKLSAHLGDIAKTVGKIAEQLPLIVQLLRDIGITLALGWGFGKLFKGISSIGRFIKFGSGVAQKGMLMPWLMRKAGLGIFTRGLFKAGLGVGLRAVLPKILTSAVGGPLGIAIGILWSIWDVVNWWRKDKDKDKEKKNIEWSTYLSELGQSGSNVINAMKLLQEAYNKNPDMTIQDAQKMASNYIGSKGANNVSITDQGQVVLNFNGTFLTIDELQDMIQQSTKAEIEKKESFWDRFKSKPENNGATYRPGID